MKLITSFNSTVEHGTIIQDEFNVNDIKNEPMLFNCNQERAMDMGGKITRAFLQNLPEAWRIGPMIIDSRTHMLMEGWYPCIPGWHHDDVVRSRPDGQPNYFDPECTYLTRHAMMLVNGDICPTEFLLGTFALEVPATGVIYKVWDDEIQKNLKEVKSDDNYFNHPKRLFCPDQQIVFFNERTLHRGTPALSSGFRFFIRASIHFDIDGRRIHRDGVDGYKNELRKQSQVYIDPINKGW